jgi:hypothetical protein
VFVSDFVEHFCFALNDGSSCAGKDFHGIFVVEKADSDGNGTGVFFIEFQIDQTGPEFPVGAVSHGVDIFFIFVVSFSDQNDASFDVHFGVDDLQIFFVKKAHQSRLYHIVVVSLPTLALDVRAPGVQFPVVGDGAGAVFGAGDFFEFFSFDVFAWDFFEMLNVSFFHSGSVVFAPPGRVQFFFVGV